MKIFVTLALLASLAFGMALEEIPTLMQQNIDRAVAILKQAKAKKKPDAKLSQAAVNKIFALFNDEFDYKLMARISLASAFNKLTPEQKKLYFATFEKSLKNNFASKLELYTDQNIDITGGKQEGNNRYYLNAKLIIENKPQSLVFKFYNKDGNWLIYDVDVLGISIVGTYRAQFQDVMNNGGFKTLIKKLETINAL